MGLRKFSFETLEVYDKARALVSDVYRIQNEFPKEERFGLGDQVRRAAVSITANLAEGSGRQSIKEKLHFNSSFLRNDPYALSMTPFPSLRQRDNAFMSRSSTETASN